MKKIIISLILIFTLSFIFIGCSKSQNSQTNERKVNPASDFEYTIMGDNDKYIDIKKYIGNNSNVIIPEEIENLPVKCIDIAAFENTEIELVDIPDTVEMICHYAFSNCKKLHTVNMGNGVRIVLEGAFKNCANLENLTLSPNISQTESEAFSNCNSLKELHIPKGFNDWAPEIFYNNSITKLTFEDGIENIGGYATLWNYEKALKEVTFPASVKKLGEWTFGDGVEHAYFLGDAPEFGKKPFGESKVTIHYKNGTKGWDKTGLEEWYTLVEE